MADASNKQGQHRRPHPQPMAGPYLEFDLAREVEGAPQRSRVEQWSEREDAREVRRFSRRPHRAEGACPPPRTPNGRSHLNPDPRGPHSGASGRTNIRPADGQSSRFGSGIGARRRSARGERVSAEHRVAAVMIMLPGRISSPIRISFCRSHFILKSTDEPARTLSNPES